MTDIHKNLKQLRLLRNLTQEEVAQKIGLTRQAISSYESGRTQPGIDLLMKFAEIYEVPLDEILYGKKLENHDLKKIRIVFTIIVAIAVFFVPPILVFGFNIMPKNVEQLQVYKEEPTGEIEEDEVEFFLVDPDPY